LFLSTQLPVGVTCRRVNTLELTQFALYAHEWEAKIVTSRRFWWGQTIKAGQWPRSNT